MRFKLWRRVMRPEAGVVLNRMPDVRRRTPARSIGPKLRSDAALAAQAVRVVALGGGTGLSPLLSGLKGHVARRGQKAGPRPIPDPAAGGPVHDGGGRSGPRR